MRDTRQPPCSPRRESSAGEVRARRGAGKAALRRVLVARSAEPSTARSFPARPRCRRRRTSPAEVTPYGRARWLPRISHCRPGWAEASRRFGCGRSRTPAPVSRTASSYPPWPGASSSRNTRRRRRSRSGIASRVRDLCERTRHRARRTGCSSSTVCSRRGLQRLPRLGRSRWARSRTGSRRARAGHWSSWSTTRSCDRSRCRTSSVIRRRSSRPPLGSRTHARRDARHRARRRPDRAQGS